MSETTTPTATAERERLVNELVSVRDDLEALNYDEGDEDTASACDLVREAKELLDDE